MAGWKVKSYLESSRGKDVIILDDREYMLSLQSQLMREYESYMKQQEELRSETERSRQRRLFIEGLQELPYVDIKQPQVKSHTVGSVGSSKSSTTGEPEQRRSTSLNGTGEIDGDEDYFKYSPGHSPGYTPNPTRNRMKDVKTRQSTRYVKEPSKPSMGEESVALLEPADDRTAIDGIDQDDEDLDTQRALLMKQLRQAKTVKGMYSTAHLVLAAPVAELKYKTEGASGLQP